MTTPADPYTGCLAAEIALRALLARLRATPTWRHA